MITGVGTEKSTMVGDIPVHREVIRQLSHTRFTFFGTHLHAFHFFSFLVARELWSGNTSGCRPARYINQFVIKAYLSIPIADLVMAKPADGAILTSYHLVLIVDVACPDELFGASSRRWRYF